MVKYIYTTAEGLAALLKDGWKVVRTRPTRLPTVFRYRLEKSA